MKKLKILVLLSFITCAFPTPSNASASNSTRQAGQKTLEACLKDDANLDVCKQLRVANDNLEKLGERLAKEAGLDGALGVIFASSTQALAQGKIQFKTSLYGIGSNVELSPDVMQVTFAIGF